MRRTIGIAAANTIYRDQVPSAFWTIRYFRDSQNEEYMVVLKTGWFAAFAASHLDEKAPGANLSKEEALARAEAYLRNEKKVDLADWNLVENQHGKETRQDRSFLRVGTKSGARSGIGPAGRAHPHATCKCRGTKFPGYRIFIKIPEAWRDAESRTTPAQLAQTYGRGIRHCAWC